MDLKKKFRAFFTLNPRAHDGFTLVELIVVIAILAILAGVGTAGYSGYITAANKGNDKVLVGNIIRAIETGTYSTMFSSNDSYQKGATNYPVGIVILSADGCDVKASTSTITTTDSTCELVTITNYVPSGGYTITETKDEVTLGALHTYHDIYNVTNTTSITYCKTHSNLNEREVDVSYTTSENCGTTSYEFTTKKYVFEDECTGVYTLYTDHVAGETVSQDNITAADGDNRVVSTETSPIYQSLVAAFGSDLSSLKLRYDGWGDAEQDGHTYATLLTYTDTMIGDIKETAENLILAVNAAALLGKDASEYLTEDYSNAADMMDSFSGYLTTQYDDVTAWMEKWNAAASGGTTYAFGLESTRDYCYAARMSYNTAFASYCSANGISSTYVEVLKDYHHTNSYGISIPDVTNTAAFSSTDADDSDTLYAQFVAAGDSDGSVFAQCVKLYEIYKDSEACKQNGETFYTTMETVAATGSEAYQYGDGGIDGYFSYYENLMQELAAYYDFIKDYNGSGMIILVTVDNGVVTCSVSPSSANPRND